ncbi:MAG TPA: erythromycin esterase family protein, partial [Cytophagaceae bacterium]
DRIGDARIVLLGEASHGTHEFYTWRTAITKRLISEKAFNIIAVEGDWPDCYRVNRFIKGNNDDGDEARQVLSNFRRWPTWMWGNWEMVALSEWLRDYNMDLPDQRKISFFGLDVYGLWETMHTIYEYLKVEDPKAAELCKRAISCFEPYEGEGIEYAKANRIMSRKCENEVIRLLKEIKNKYVLYDNDPDAGLNAWQSAHVIANAERYYRTLMALDRADSWNLRDYHMAETLNKLLEHFGPASKIIVWEHNTHIGDARATPMYRDGMINVGQLVREQHSSKGVVAVGFGTYSGTVCAAREWGAPMEIMNVPPAKPNSVEEILHRESQQNKLLVFEDEIVRKHFDRILGHRAIGVVYNPNRERANYVPTILPSRYDAFIYLDQTKALHPLDLIPDVHQIPETYPFAF